MKLRSWHFASMNCAMGDRDGRPCRVWRRDCGFHRHERPRRQRSRRLNTLTQRPSTQTNKLKGKPHDSETFCFWLLCLFENEYSRRFHHSFFEAPVEKLRCKIPEEPSLDSKDPAARARPPCFRRNRNLKASNTLRSADEGIEFHNT